MDLHTPAIVSNAALRQHVLNIVDEVGQVWANSKGLRAIVDVGLETQPRQFHPILLIIFACNVQCDNRDQAAHGNTKQPRLQQ